jgi:hypothetical protein
MPGFDAIKSVAIKSTTATFDRGSVPANVADALSRLTEDDPEPFIRDLSKDALG